MNLQIVSTCFLVHEVLRDLNRLQVPSLLSQIDPKISISNRLNEDGRSLFSRSLIR